MSASLDLIRDPRRLDLDLLRLFVALIEERHLTRAGARLFLSQPAASGRLARLRDFFDDPLVVRSGNELAPTARAEALYAVVAPALLLLESTLAAETPFDPATDHRVFRLGASDDCLSAVLPALLARLREEAPQCQLVLRETDYISMPRLLAEREVSTVLGYLDDGLPANSRRRRIGESGWVVMRDAATPAVDRLEAYCARPHAMVTPAGDLHGFIDETLAQHNQRRMVAVGVTAFGLLLRALRGTDLVATVPMHVARQLVGQGLVADAPPVPVPPSMISLAWTEAADRDPAERWFRGLVTECWQQATR